MAHLRLGFTRQRVLEVVVALDGDGPHQQARDEDPFDRDAAGLDEVADGGERSEQDGAREDQQVATHRSA